MTVADAKTIRRPRKAAPRPASSARRSSTPSSIDDVKSPRHGLAVIAGKEFADLILSVRFLVLIVHPGAGRRRRGLRHRRASSRARAHQKLRQVSPSLFLSCPSPSPPGQPAHFVRLIVSFLGPLLGIAFGFDAINGERSEGTLPRLLSQPIHRDDVINGKFVAGLAAIGLVLAVVMVLIVGRRHHPARHHAQRRVGPAADHLLAHLDRLHRLLAGAGATVLGRPAQRGRVGAGVALGIWLLVSCLRVRSWSACCRLHRARRGPTRAQPNRSANATVQEPVSSRPNNPFPAEHGGSPRSKRSTWARRISRPPGTGLGRACRFRSSA